MEWRCAMIACSKPYPRLEWLLNSFADWRQHRRELNEMRQLDEVEFGRIASDLKVSPDDLDELVRQGPRAADELARLLKVLGIDGCLLARTELPTLSASARCA